MNMEGPNLERKKSPKELLADLEKEADLKIEAAKMAESDPAGAEFKASKLMSTHSRVASYIANRLKDILGTAGPEGFEQMRKIKDKMDKAGIVDDDFTDLFIRVRDWHKDIEEDKETAKMAMKNPHVKQILQDEAYKLYEAHKKEKESKQSEGK
jgi:hypothetical protein